MKKALFEELLKSVKQAQAIERGELKAPSRSSDQIERLPSAKDNSFRASRHFFTLLGQHQPHLPTDRMRLASGNRELCGAQM